MESIWITLIILGLVALGIGIKIYKKRPWLGNYIKFAVMHRSPKPVLGQPVHVMFLFVDHFEPKEQCQDPAIQRERMRNWYERYPEIASQFKDADGHYPQHTWFYQVEDWEHSDLDKEYLQQLAELTYDGFGEVELHIHHNQPVQGYFPDVDTGEKLEALILRMKDFFSQTGALITAEEKPRKTYGFIHGMFALDNSHGGVYCGVNNEFQILRKTGCFADFTMPAGVYIAQTKKINSIYYVIDDPQRPRSHDNGVDVKVGGQSVGDLMTIQGPLRVNFFRHPKYWKASVENANVDDAMPPTPFRIDQWIDTNIHVKGRPEWVFVKVHTHGSREASFPVYFEEPAKQMFRHLVDHYNDGRRYILHFVTAREAYNIIKAAEAGQKGDPNQYRDFLVKPYANTRIKTKASYLLERWTDKDFNIKILDAGENVDFELKHQKLSRINADFLKELTFQYNQEQNRIELELTGEGKCFLEFRDFRPAKMQVNGKLQALNGREKIDIQLAAASLNKIQIVGSNK